MARAMMPRATSVLPRPTSSATRKRPVPSFAVNRRWKACSTVRR